MQNTTPLMRQYWEVKSAHMDKILLFRMGDFFEMFHDDAVTAAPVLGIALTKRNQKAQDETPMCGVPHHSVGNQINKLLKAGFKVAICDQIEDPKLAKGIVKRAVTRILSPGMVYDTDTLDQFAPNYMASWDGEEASFLDSSTGEAFWYHASSKEEFLYLVSLLNPKELVLTSSMAQALEEGGALETRVVLTRHELTGETNQKPLSAELLIQYACYMQGTDIRPTLSPFEARELGGRLSLNTNTLRHLEVFETYRGEVKGSLFGAINRTKTSAGARKLRNWLAFPLLSESQIAHRLDQVADWAKSHERLEEVRTVLSQMGDIERRLGRISTPGCNGRDLISLADSLQAGVEVSRIANHQDKALDACSRLAGSIKQTLVEAPPLSVKDGHLIRLGVSKELDELIRLSTDAQQLLTEMELREKERTGISSLKIKYNNVFGYFIEVTHTHKSKVPADYRRKQTLAQAERFVTDELESLETKILSAKTKRAELEYELFDDLKKSVLAESPALLALAKTWSEIDVFSSLAWVAAENSYVRPGFSASGELILRDSRHPVVEQESLNPFVPNNIDLKAGDCLLLTGPNMAGKSTIMRQIAVSSILAQMGSFVPAKEAHLPIFDRVFTRIGASDFLAEGLSTFMVEMKETAEMLEEATPKSLLVLDEIGRGTSTFDGMSLAQAILEYILSETKAMTLFATHYHELTKLSEDYPQLVNAHMSIRERGGQISFLHTLVNGPANKSYGIHVARLAGLPEKVTRRASEILVQVESQKPPQLSFFDAPLTEKTPANVEKLRELVGELKEYPIQTTTPLDALNRMARWQKDLQGLDLEI